MVFCDNCVKNVAGVRINDGLILCCDECGKVLENNYFSEEKISTGQSELSGRYVRTIQSEYSASRQRTLDRDYDEIKYLSLDDDNLANQALAFYRRRAEEAKNLGPPQSAAEATKQMLITKQVAPKNPKKVRSSDNHDYLKSKFEDKIQDDDLGLVDEFEDGGMHEDYYGNADEA
ncbi:uncharacterized protein LOC130737873 isoform X2 [Lotus japonicus]|uniref:uncharacterized protein LOC130737873 isoform X2 n=1 Tax=Lotus japonicus TaxID=34305 RepID=UPI00258A9015|nr:uncharacterized protein LOC130737873 isoform X2 [Lotus japonicus]